MASYDFIPDGAKKGSCIPEDKDSYYVYILRSHYGRPFYVGKGIRSRVNDHFSPHSLREDTLKNRAIKKFGVDECYREIVTYLDSEEEALELESFLIEQIGCILDGNGPLTNIHRPGQLPSVYDVSTGVERQKTTKYTDDLIVKFYRLEFELCMPRALIEAELGIGAGYQLVLARGESRRKLYSEYVLSGKIANNRECLGYTPRSPVKIESVPDSILLEEYNHVINGRKTIKEVSESVDLSHGTVWNIFRGKVRKHLGLDYKRDLKTPLKGGRRKYDRDKAIALIQSGASSKEFINTMGCSYGYYVYIKKLLEEWDYE